LGLTIVPEPRTFKPVGKGNVVTSPGFVLLSTLEVDGKRLTGLKIPVCDMDDDCRPAHGLLGLDLFPKLGITLEGVPHCYPSHVYEDEEEANDDGTNFQDDCMAQHQVAPDARQQLLEAIQPQLLRNSQIPEDSFCTHPSATVSLDTGDAKPTYVSQYRVSDFMSAHIDAQIQKWDETTVTVPAPADSPWNNPLIGALDPASKRKGKEPRVCIDPRKLNELLQSDPRGIPNVNSVHTALRGFKFISEIDLRKSFTQFRVRAEDQIKTTFTWRGKKRMFQGSPFGLKPLSQIFQGVIEQIFHETRDFTTPFIDNIYVHSNGSFDEHIQHVIQALELLNENNLRINPDRCFFGYTAVNVLGHLLSGTSKKPDPAKISALFDWPVPATGKDIESFLGFTNYLREFVPCYAEIAAPLERLRKSKHLGDLWDGRCQKSFEMFKDVLSRAPTLSTPLPGVPYSLQTDASQYGVGWVLYQVHPDTGKNHYVIFGAKALQKGQVNYGATRRELLAIVVALQECRHFIYGTHFRLFTDHQSLTYLFTQKKLNFMQLNWIDTLFDYDFTVIHRPGVEMVLPDALSRMFAQFRGGSGPRVRRIVHSEEVSKYPDKELHDFINLRFQKNFVTATEREALLEAAHSSGHFGAESLFKQLWQDGYYWPGMRADCSSHVCSCLPCLRFNVGKSGYHPRQFIQAELPFEHISIDTISGFKTTERGNNYIVVITDMCTRYKLLIAQQTKTAAETARNLWWVFCTFPLPKILQSDNGTEFCNAIIKELMNLLGVNHKLIAAYTPRANGTAENTVGSTQDSLRKMTNGDLTDWDLFLPSVQLALNAKFNDSTKTSPASLLFGMNINAFANYSKATSKLLSTHQLLERAKIIQDVLRPTVQSVFRKKQVARTASANSSLRLTKPVPVGTLVMLKDPTRTSKHQPKWIGPFRIVQQKKGGTYVLQNLDLSLYHRQPPRDHLKVIDGKADITFDELYYVERILDHRGPPSKRQFLVKWLNYPSSDNTWEPQNNLTGCENYLEDYWRARKAQKGLAVKLLRLS
jgi:transposase InsO family protein